MVKDFQEKVKKGFIACKNDINLIKTENHNLKNNISELNGEIKELKSLILNLKDSVENKLKNNINNNFKEQRNENLNDEINSEFKEKTNFDEIKLKSKKIEIKKDPYEVLLEYKVKSNKKDILKQKIQSMVGEKGLSLSELKFMFVEHFKYCSKGTFYNYLKQLELERLIKIERENSKNFVFPYIIRNQI